VVWSWWYWLRFSHSPASFARCSLSVRIASISALLKKFDRETVCTQRGLGSSIWLRAGSWYATGLHQRQLPVPPHGVWECCPIERRRDESADFTSLYRLLDLRHRRNDAQGPTKRLKKAKPLNAKWKVSLKSLWNKFLYLELTIRFV
jgi:hypothetical protein